MRTHPSTRRPGARRAVVAFLALALATPIAGAAPAHADVVDAACTGSQTITYSPGLRLFDQSVTTTGSTAYSCTSGPVTSGSSGFTVTDSRSCLSALDSAVDELITWNDGTSSLFTGTATVATAGGTTVITKTGTITVGRFAGDAALEVVTGPNIAALTACLTSPGVTSSTEAVVLTITP